MTETKAPTEPATAESKETGTKDPPKEKAETVMDAASALTSLQEEENGSRPTTPKPAENDSKKEKTEDKEEEINDEDHPNSPKRFLPDHKKPDAAPTFPEKVSTTTAFALFNAALESSSSFVLHVEFVLPSTRIFLIFPD